MLLNCADNITNRNYKVIKDNQTWCSVGKYNNGEPREMYRIDYDTSYVEGAPEFYTVTIDSVKSDSIFVMSTNGKMLIVQNEYGMIDEIIPFNKYYDMEIDNWGRADLYYGGGDFVKCIE